MLVSFLPNTARGREGGVVARSFHLVTAVERAHLQRGHAVVNPVGHGPVRLLVRMILYLKSLTVQWDHRICLFLILLVK